MKWTQHSVSIFTSKYRESVVLDFARFFEKIRNLRSTNGTVDHAGNPAARQELQIRCGGLISDVDSSSALGVAPNGVQRVPLPRTTCSNNKERTHSRYTHTHTAAHRISWQYKLMAGRQSGRHGTSWCSGRCWGAPTASSLRRRSPASRAKPAGVWAEHASSQQRSTRNQVQLWAVVKWVSEWVWCSGVTLDMSQCWGCDVARWDWSSEWGREGVTAGLYEWWGSG
jgi:hypothetical protein